MESSGLVVASRDYINKKTQKSNKKKSKPQKKTQDTLMLALAVIIIVLFSVILYFLIANKPDAKKITKPPKQTVSKRENIIPPKPEEHWHYIKELEKGTMLPEISSQKPANGLNAMRPLSAEQRQILESFQTKKSQAEKVEPAKKTTPPKTVVIVEKPAAKKSAPKPAPAPTTERWMVQCGSFKTQSGAESVKAQIAFAGMNSRIAANSGWYRVVLGPYNSRPKANEMLTKLKNHGMSICIVVSGG